MVGANISKTLWEWAQVRLKIVFIHENVQFGSGPILLDKMGPVPEDEKPVPVRWKPVLQNCVHLLKYV